MVITDTLEGTIDNALWFHYDMLNDVLYLRLASFRDSQAIGEESPDGMVVLKDAQSDKIVGLTIVNWWQRFGMGSLPDSISLLQQKIEPWAKKLAA